MINAEAILFTTARNLGYRSTEKHLFELIDWLREEKQIHVEVGSIWDDLNNKVESYCYTIIVPINIYYRQPINQSGVATYTEALHQGIAEALSLLKNYNEQKSIKVSDDQVIIAYLKGYGDKGNLVPRTNYKTNLEKYAYLLGRQGDYIEEGLTEDDILNIGRNEGFPEETLQLK